MLIVPVQDVFLNIQFDIDHVLYRLLLIYHMLLVHFQQTARGEAGFYRGFKNPNLPTTEFGWEIDPMGFRATIREMYSRYRLPMIVTENGLGAYDK